MFFITHDTDQVGGGIAAGLALLGGAAFAYKKHEEHKEEVRISFYLSCPSTIDRYCYHS